MNGSTVYNTSRFSQQDFHLAIASWRESLCGNDVTNALSIPGMENLLLMRDLDSEDLRRTMNRGPDSPILFGDKAPTASGELKLQYDRILRLALPYGTVGCRGYRSRELLADILYALDWMHDYMYGANVLTDSSFRSYKLFDWWDWYVGGACPMMDTLMILYEDITPELIEKYTTPVRFLSTQMHTQSSSAMTRIVTLTPLALLTFDRELLSVLFRECEDLLQIHDSGRNMRSDYCYRAHGMPYNVAYGVINLSRIGKVLQILKPTPLAYPVANKYNLMNMIRYTFAPVMYRGRTLAPMAGRAMQYNSCASHLLSEFHYLFGLFGPEEDRELFQIIRTHGTEAVRRQLISNFTEGVTLEEYRTINAFPNTRAAEVPKTDIFSYGRYYAALNDPQYEVPPMQLGYMWYSGDTCVLHRNASMAGLRMCSARNPGYECINGDNGDGWYTGEGALYLYTPDAPEEFTARWWQNADKHLIPGTTVEDRHRESMFFDKSYVNNQHFVGGVALDGQFVTATMDQEAFHCEVDEGRPDLGYGRSWPVYPCTLTSQKSWFMLDRVIVAIGTRISARDGYDVRTVVENRMLKDSPDALQIDGQNIPFQPGDTVCHGIHRVHILGTGGYLFPQGGSLTVRFYENGGVKFVSLWLSHGRDPENGEYAYILLPNASPQETLAYDLSNLEILANDCHIQAVREKHSGLLGMVFRRAGQFAGITARQPSAVMLRTDSDGRLCSFAACDPTQLQEHLAFSIETASALCSDDPAVCITPGEAAAEITVSCDSARGRAFCVKQANKPPEG